MNNTSKTSSKRSWIDESKRKQPETPVDSKPKPPNPAHLRILSGNVDFALRCSKMLPVTTSVLIEVFGTVISVRPGGKSETIVLLRNDTGPILQVSYYSVQFPLPEELKDVRCVCRIKSDGRFHAVKIKPETFCFEYIARLQAISVHFLKKLVNRPEML